MDGLIERLRGYRDWLTATLESAEHEMREALEANGEGDHPCLYDIDGTKTDSDPGACFAYGEMYQARDALNRFDTMFPEIRENPKEMAEGYRAMADDNREDAEMALPAQAEVILRDES